MKKKQKKTGFILETRTKLLIQKSRFEESQSYKSEKHFEGRVDTEKLQLLHKCSFYWDETVQTVDGDKVNLSTVTDD